MNTFNGNLNPVSKTIKSMKKKIFYSLLIAFLLLQFWPRFKNNGSAYGKNDLQHTVIVPEKIDKILTRACNDCHTNFTHKPWYCWIQPVDLWINHHVEEGKRKLNFSVFKNWSLKKQLHKLHEVEEQVEENEMPLSNYITMHNNAKLSDDDRKALINWVHTAQDELINANPQEAAKLEK